MPARPIDQNVTFIYTETLEETASWYAEVLGLEMVLDQGQCRIFQASPSGYLGICFARPGRFVEPKGVVYTFVTPDVDGWHAHLTERGADVVDTPHLSEKFNVYAFFCRDPNGYILEFQSFRDPRWPKPVGG